MQITQVGQPILQKDGKVDQKQSMLESSTTSCE